MSQEFKPTKEKKVVNGNAIYLNDVGDIVLEHVSGNV